jgi:SAM-dependent methyltransferase
MEIDDYQQLWDERAQYFDLDYGSYEDDFEFFEDYVDSNTSVLELGSGTGRLPLYLVQHGKRADGLDLSLEMVQQARKKASEIKDVSFFHGSMSEFDIEKTYDLIINQGNSFLMMSDHEKRRTLECVRDHLLPSGKFVVQIANPNRWRENPQGPILHLHHTTDGDSFINISYTQDIDEEEQINHMVWFRENINKETGEVAKKVWPINFQFLEHDGAVELIRNAGFEIQKEYGDFDRSPYAEDSNKMIFECIPENGY